jgi:ATP-dependent DNA helicase RecG
MSRLLEGDVGSGKTVVAAAATFFASETKPKNQSFGKLQVAYMAPTEILAKQIFSEFIKIFKPYGKKIGLLTSKDVRVFPSKISSNEAAKISKNKLKE